jgi:hypothetical protein
MLLYLSFFILTLAPVQSLAAPAWTLDMSRQIESDGIIYVGRGENRDSNVALFLAKEQGTSSIMSECGGIPSKFIVMLDQHIELRDGNAIAYAKMGIKLNACDYSKTPAGRNDPTLVNPITREGHELYQKLILTLSESKTNQIPIKYFDQIQKLISGELTAFKRRVTDVEEKLDALKKDSDGKSKYPSIIRIEQINNIYSPSDTKYQECMETYHDYISDAKLESQNSRILGNLAEGKAATLNNKAMMQLQRCDRYKRKK